MKPRHAYLIMRVMVRLHEQGMDAYRYGRDADAGSIFRLIGRLEYKIFGSASLAEEA